VASVIVFVLECFLDAEQMKQYGWRIPYFLALIPGSLIIYFRQYLEETEEFQEHLGDKGQGSIAGTTTRGPLQEVVVNHKKALLVATMGAACTGAFWFVPTFYGPTFLQDLNPSIPTKDVTLSEAIVYALPTVLAPAVGMLVDRWGAGKSYTLAVILTGVVLPVPLWYYWGHLQAAKATAGMYVGEIIVGILCALTTSIYAWIVELFPVEVRATGVSVAYNLGVGVCGGFGPLLCAVLKEALPPRGIVSAPAAVCLACGFISVVGMAASRVLAQQGKLKLTHIREHPY